MLYSLQTIKLKHFVTYDQSSLTTEMAKTEACALLNTRLDYANSVLLAISDANIKKLQRV